MKTLACMGYEELLARAAPSLDLPELRGARPSDQAHTGAMVALMPAAADAARLAVDGGENADELHLTLLYLGKAADIPPETQRRITSAVRATVEDAIGPDYDLPVAADGFAISAFNPGSADREPCIVLGVGGGDLAAIRGIVEDTVREVQATPAGFTLPKQHEPWIPHVTLLYSDDVEEVAQLADRVGPITFDRLRVAFAGQITDIPLGVPGSENRDGYVRARFGQVAVTPNSWLRERANRYLGGLPELRQDMTGEFGDLVLGQALMELDLQHLRAWNPAAHKRWPKGHPKAGKFREMVDLLKEAIAKYDGTGKPFDHFSRDQLMKAAKQRNIALVRGEDKDSIAEKLLADLKPSSAAPADSKAKKKPAGKPKPPAPGEFGSGTNAAGIKDGLEDMEEHRLKSLAREYDIKENQPREKLVMALRAADAMAPDVRFSQNRELNDLLRRLKEMGRREPADRETLKEAAVLLADGRDVKVVAKGLRLEADKQSSAEDAQTMRHLASDLTKKKPNIPEYIDEKGNVDLIKLGAMHGIDVKGYMPSDIDPWNVSWKGGLQERWDYEANHPWDRAFRIYVEKAKNGFSRSEPRAKTVRALRERAASTRRIHSDAAAARDPWNSRGRQAERRVIVATGIQAAADLDRIADLLEAAKIPPKKTAPTLGGTVLGQPTDVDETRFKPRRIKSVLKHRGEDIPRDFVHKGLATALLKNPNRPHRPGLTRDESYAMDLYTAVAVADGLNASLRAGRNVHGTVKIRTGETIDLDRVARDMDAAIANSELADDTVLWRGAVPLKADYRRLVPGAIYTETGYFSTSSHEKAARDIIAWRMQKLPSNRQPVLFKILAPKGTKAALGHEALSEAVLPHGQELRVVRVDESTSPPVAVMEVIPRDAEPGRVRGRVILDEFDYDTALKKGPPGGPGGDWMLAAIQAAQGFDGAPQVVTPQQMDEIVAAGATQLHRGIRNPANANRGGEGRTPAQLAEDYRTGKMFPGKGVYGSGTYATPDRAVALKYGKGEESGMLRLALRRDAKIVNYEDLLKMPAIAGITASTQKLTAQRQAELASVDPADTAAVNAILAKYDKLMERRGSKSQFAADLGRLAALLGYDAIYKRAEYNKKKSDGYTEYVILNRTATYVEQAKP